MAIRETFVKITGIDNTSRSINTIAEALKRLQNEINKPVADTTDKTASYKAASYKTALKDIAQTRAENLRTEKVIAAEIGRTDKLTADNKAKEAKRGANAVIASLNEIKKESDGGSTFSDLKTSAFAAATGIGAVAASALAVGTSLFALAKSASDYGSAIKDVSDKTGLSAESLSTLKLAADQSGSSLEGVSGSVTKFSKLIGSAAEGSNQARESLIRLGLDPKQAINDLDGSLEKVFTSIYDAKNPIVATKLATEAFGKSGADLIPVVKQMNGNFEAFKEQAKKLGVVLSQDDVNAADDFGDSLTALEAQVKGVTNQFALGFLPAITTALKEISGELSGNQNVWREWGEFVGGVILRIERGAKLTAAVLKDLLTANREGRNTANALIENADGYERDERAKQIRANANDPNRPDFLKQQDAAIKGFGTSTGGSLGGTSNDRAGGTKDIFKLSPDGQALVNAASKLGVSPLDLATIIGFETGGTFSTKANNGLGFKGLIQFGKPERQQFGVNDGQSFKEQIQTSVVAYFESRFGKVGKATEGASLDALYRTVITGSPNGNANAKDAFGNSANSVLGSKLIQQQRQAALKKFFGGNAENVPQEKTRDYAQELQNLRDLNKEAEIANVKRIAQTSSGIELQTEAKISDIVQSRLTTHQEYIANLQQELGINAKIQQIIEQTTNYEEEQTLRVENSIFQQTLDLLNAKQDLDVLATQNADDLFVSRRRDLSLLEEIVDLTKERTKLEDEITNSQNPATAQLRIQNELLRDKLDLIHKEEDSVISINRSRLELSQKGIFSKNQSDAKVLDFLNNQIKSVSESFADFRIGIAQGFLDQINSPFDALSKKLEKLPPLIKGIAQSFLSLASDIIKAFSQKLILRLLGLDGNSTGTNSGGGFGSILSSLLGRGGASSGGSSSGGFNLGSLFGGSSGGGIFNFGSRSASSSGLLSTTPGAIGTSFVNSQGKIVNTGGGIGLSGGLGIAGIAASVIGSAIGGRFGNVLSSAGTGLSLGLTFGGPIGGAIGAGVGALLGLFQGDPKRKKDAKENIPALNKGFTDAFAQLQQILKDSDALKFNPPESALDKANEVYSQIKSGFGITFESKKYKKESAALIAQKTSEADALISQIKASVTNAQSFGRDASALVPVFASGAFISQFNDFKRRNGFLRGAWTGRDTLPSMLAEGEMVLNPSQQNRVKSVSGFDPFKFAGIPNYADGVSFANPSPNVNNKIVIQPNFTLVINGAVLDDQFEAYLLSEDGKRIAVNTVRQGNKDRIS